MGVLSTEVANLPSLQGALDVQPPFFDGSQSASLEQVLIPGVLGSGASIGAVSLGTVELTGLLGLVAGHVGYSLRVTNAATPANNGTFTILSVDPGGTTAVVANPNAVAGDLGAIIWQVAFAWNTGIVLGPLVANSTLTMQLESRSVSTNNANGNDNGALRFMLVWGAAPVVPGDALTFKVIGSNIIGNLGLIPSLLGISTLIVNASNELVFSFASGKLADVLLLLKLTVSPVAVAPFSPAAP